MSAIKGDFVKLIASVWHRFVIAQQEAETLADMLVPMDDAGEEVAEYIEFDYEPSDFYLTLEELAEVEENK
ncbi:MAG: hypothetical protein CMM58_03320 [Rhodospirillaceae bacterium]|mgnify:CR=1 FL=1|nr:hypothetical protein [Rhodospirillaceae bacterium]|tara:strand:+ start:2331 stop:2543 length:213 start_codon:yes stop_codon:yes gene_type:complete